MQRGFALALALAAALSWNAPAAAQSQSKEEKQITEVGGRTLEQWIKDITHKDASRRESALRAIPLFGPERAYEAVPAMLTELRRHTDNSPIDASVRVNLAIDLGAILSAKKNPDVKLVKDAVVLLTRLLRDSQGIVKFRAAQALSVLGTEARPAVNDVLPLLRDRTSYEVRQAGAMTLGKIAGDRTGPASAVVINLTAILSDSTFQVRQAACQSLATLGTPADPQLKAGVIKALEPLAKKDPEATVQIWAYTALMAYTGKAVDLGLEFLAHSLHKGESATRTQAAQALASCGPLAKETVGALIGALKDEDPNVAGWAIVALGRLESAQGMTALQAYIANRKNDDPLKKLAVDTMEFNKKKMTGALK